MRLDAGDGHGKGLFAARNIKGGDEVFRERCLVRAHTMKSRVFGAQWQASGSHSHCMKRCFEGVIATHGR